jgi:hypothetical protein
MTKGFVGNVNQSMTTHTMIPEYGYMLQNAKSLVVSNIKRNN